VQGEDQTGGRTGSWGGALLWQNETKMEWTAVVCTENKEKSSVFRRDPMVKT
jgi:hypothetical protein